MRIVQVRSPVRFKYRKLSFVNIFSIKLLETFEFSSQIISRFSDVMWALNLKYQFLHDAEEFDTDHENMRLFIRPSGISLNLPQSLPNDFQCRTCVGTHPILPWTARLGVYLPTPK